MPTRLYLISPPAIDLAPFALSLKSALGGGDVGAFQLRLKDVTDAHISDGINSLMPLCHEKDVAFIINDRPDLCAQFKCDGVHLGQEDLETMPIAKARQIIGPDPIIGITCHASKHLAMEAGEQGADYVAFGAFYDTTSKPREKLEKWGTPTPDILRWWHEYMTLPCVAIGGITPANCSPLVEAGADFIAVINAVWNHPKGAAAAIAAFARELGNVNA